MSETQKIIKYFAITLAVLLIISIFYTLFGIVSSVFGYSQEKENTEYTIQTFNSNNIDNLDIEIGFSKLTFKIDNEFKIETNNDYINVRENRNKIIIEEKNNLFGRKNINNEIVVYIKADQTFKNIAIEAGSGNINVDSLNTKNLDLDLGAGSINFNKLIVSVEADIDSGAGKFIINSGSINNLDLDMGVGEVYLKGVLTGNNDIDAGVGTLSIDLLDTINNYKLNINKGIGEIKINNEVVKNNYNTIGNNIINIDGGIGNISINTID